MKVYDKNDRLIHPSENILAKTTFGKQFHVLQVICHFDSDLLDIKKTYVKQT